MVKITKIELSCPDCINSSIIEDTKQGYNVCSSCGLTVGGRIIDEASEWRTFTDSNSADPSRVGGPSNPLLDVEQLDTMISGTHGLARTQLKSTMRGPERALLNGFSLIQTYCDRANIPQTISDQSKVFFKNVVEKKISKGKNVESVVAACIHLACKSMKCPRTFKEISIICNVPKEEIGKSYKVIEKHFDKMKIIGTDEIVARFCSNLSLGIEVQKMAVKVSKKAMECGCGAGKSPVSVAAAIIYMMTYLYSRDKKVQKDIHCVTKVSEVTIKNTYKELINYKYVILSEEDFPKSVIDSLPNT
ncbi:transcription initiation factor IIB [Conglomerata obtusa]